MVTERPIRARSRKRRIQPRIFLRAARGFSYSDRAKRSLGEEDIK